MARRRYQRGSLQLRGTKRKCWYLVWREDVADSAGKVTRNQRATNLGTIEDLPTKPLARRRADLILASSCVNELGYRPRMSATFSEVAEQWKAHVMIHLKEGTRIKAQDHLRAHIIPEFGTMPLDAIGNMEVQAFVTRLSKTMRPKSTKNVLGTLSSVAKMAKAWGLTPCQFDAHALTLPRDRRPKRDRAFSLEQVRGVMLRASQPWRAVYALAALAALRGGEILGLRREDVDMANRKIVVRCSISPSRRLQDVKSAAGGRTIPMADSLVEILQDFFANHWRPNPDDLLFCTEAGRPLSHTKVLERHLWPLLRELGIEQRGLHAFRHTATSLLIEERVPLPLVQQIVGHAHVQTTLGIYAHVIRPEHRDAMDKLGRVVNCDRVVIDREGKSLIM